MDILCPLCASTRIGLFSAVDAGENCFNDIYRLYSCVDCGLVFTYPVPEDEKILARYGEDYYSFRSQSLESLAFWKHAARAIATIMRSLRGSGSRYAVLLKRLLFLFMRNIPQMTPLFFDASDILDVGCGAGDQMALWQETGLQAWGVDVSPLAAIEGKKRGLRISTGELKDAGFASGSFDIVYANHVIEHIRDPGATLGEIRRVLKRGGVLMVGVPNIDSALFGLLKAKWFHLDVPRHLLHFSPARLAAMLEEAGFSIQQSYTITPAGGLFGSLGNLFPRFEIVYRDRRLFVPYIIGYIILTVLLVPANVGLRGDWLYVIAVKDTQRYRGS